jgi:hypothetical protein
MAGADSEIGNIGNVSSMAKYDLFAKDYKTSIHALEKKAKEIQTDQDRIIYTQEEIAAKVFGILKGRKDETKNGTTKKDKSKLKKKSNSRRDNSSEKESLISQNDEDEYKLYPTKLIQDGIVYWTTGAKNINDILRNKTNDTLTDSSNDAKKFSKLIQALIYNFQGYVPNDEIVLSQIIYKKNDDKVKGLTTEDVFNILGWGSVVRFMLDNNVDKDKDRDKWWDIKDIAAMSKGILDDIDVKLCKYPDYFDLTYKKRQVTKERIEEYFDIGRDYKGTNAKSMWRRFVKIISIYGYAFDALQALDGRIWFVLLLIVAQRINTFLDEHIKKLSDTLSDDPVMILDGFAHLCIGLAITGLLGLILYLSVRLTRHMPKCCSRTSFWCCTRGSESASKIKKSSRRNREYFDREMKRYSIYDQEAATHKWDYDSECDDPVIAVLYYHLCGD